MPSASGSGNVTEQTDQPRAAAFFDVDGTLVSTHIVHQYVFIKKTLADRNGALSRAAYRLWLAAFYARCIQYLYLDRVSRTRMNIAFYRNYSGLNADEVRSVADQCCRDLLQPHLFTEVVECLNEHASAGRRIVLVTGSIDFLIAPLANYLTSQVASCDGIDLVARTLVDRNGVFTGELDGAPIGESEKGRAAKQYADSHNIDLAQSYAYGDSIADLQMLELVGHPNAVNPDAELKRRAQSSGWPCHNWSHDKIAA